MQRLASNLSMREPFVHISKHVAAGWNRNQNEGVGVRWGQQTANYSTVTEPSEGHHLMALASLESHEPHQA